METDGNVPTIDSILDAASNFTGLLPFVRRYGRLFIPQKLPSQYRSGPPQMCFANSYRMAMKHPVTYVEGFAVIDPCSRLAILHAWCVDGDGKVLDRTLNNGCGYFGIPFQTSFLRKTITEREKKRKAEGKYMYLGLLDNWQEDMPLIKLLADKPELWLAAMP